MFEIKTTAPKVSRELTVIRDLGDDLKGMVAIFGEGVVYNMALDNIVIAAQSFVRGKLSRVGDKRMADADIEKAFAAWVPMVRGSADPAKKIETIKSGIAKLSEEQRAELLALLQPEKKAKK